MVRPGIGGHDQNGILEIDRSAAGVRDSPVVQNLEQDIEHVGMRLFDLVKQHHGVRVAADFLGQLPCLVVADIPGRSADDARDRVLFHKLRHVQPNQRLRGMEQLVCQRFDQLGLTHAGRSSEDERDRLAFIGDSRAIAFDGAHHGVNRLVLSDDA